MRIKCHSITLVILDSSITLQKALHYECELKLCLWFIPLKSHEALKYGPIMTHCLDSIGKCWYTEGIIGS